MVEVSADGLAREFVAAIGERSVIADRDRLLSYESDWTGQWQGRARLVLQPGSTAEVVSVLRISARAGVGVVIQGGNTGLSGGSVPLDDEVVLHTGRLVEIGEVNVHSRQATFGAGVTLESAQRQARSVGLDVAVDLAARGQATIGGMVATNAGGAMALRYGTMRSSVCGLEAVLADGKIVRRLSGLPKDNAGYDLPALLIGSEGTLGVITGARLSLVERPAERVVALAGVTGFEEAVELVTALRDAVGDALEAAECFDRLGLELVCRHRELTDPLSQESPVYLLLDLAAEGATELLAAAVEERYLEQMIVGEGSERQAALWAYREGLNEASSAEAVVRKYDISVRIEDIPEFADLVRGRIACSGPSLRVTLYGHIGDGNIHINVLGADADEQRASDQIVSEVVERFGGTISAEHGIGLAKRGLLEPTRSRDEIQTMWAIKRALDPAGLLGRDRVLPPPTSDPSRRRQCA